MLGGLQGANQLRRWVRAAQQRQRELLADISGKSAGTRARQGSPSRVAVDAVFFKRLTTILAMCGGDERMHMTLSVWRDDNSLEQPQLN